MWQEFQSPDFAVCFEKGGIIAAAKHDGTFATWHLYKRSADGALEQIQSAGVYCSLGGPHIPTGLGWAESQIAKLG